MVSNAQDYKIIFTYITVAYTYSLTNLGIHLAKIMHDTVQVQFSSTKYHMLSRLFNLNSNISSTLSNSSLEAYPSHMNM